MYKCAIQTFFWYYSYWHCLQLFGLILEIAYYILGLLIIHNFITHMVRATDAERADKLREKRKQIEAQIAAIEARRKTKERRFLTRQKIIIGAAVIAEANSNKAFAEELTKLLQKIVTRDVDKVVIKEFMEKTEGK